ncbi:MAG: TIM barrel protein [Dehalococcoidales bacterium]|nr:TIM barrel protein [Dehalococcoidales bacterium]
MGRVESLLFGTGGVPHSAKPGSTAAGIRRIAELGLDCMEIEFVRGVKMSEDGAREVARAASENGIKLSVHAPYYINLNAHDPATLEASMGRLLQACRIGALCGAGSVVVHSAFYLGDPPGEVYQRVKQSYGEAVRQLHREDNRITVRPEIMGKGSEFGTLEEVLDLCTEVDGLAPGIDFAHLHARSGGNNSYKEFSGILNKVRERLGRAGLENLHIHFSGIKYGAKGELSHLNLKESDLAYRELLQALRDTDAGGLVVCESPNLEEDAQLLKTTYDSLAKET